MARSDYGRIGKERIVAAAWGALFTAHPGGAHRRRIARTSRTSTPRSSATRSPSSSRRSESRTATRCGSSGRRRAVLEPGLADCSSGRDTSLSNVVRTGSAASRQTSPLNRFIFRRGRLRGLAHFFIMWGCVLAVAITFPLVFGWIHFETVPGDLDVVPHLHLRLRRPRPSRSIRSSAFLIFHGLVWSAFLVDRRRDAGDAPAHAATTARRRCSASREDFLPLMLLFAISITGLLLTASYTWMKGYGYDFLALLHAITVIFTLLWLPFGKFFHIFQRPAQLGVELLQGRSRAGRDGRAARRCGTEYAPRAPGRRSHRGRARARLSLRDDAAGRGAEHYQRICPSCRRTHARRSRRASCGSAREPRTLTPMATDFRNVPTTTPRRRLRPAPEPAWKGCASTPASSPTGSSTRTAASAASSAASSSRSRTTQVIGFEPWYDFPFNRACSVRRASSATCRDPIPTA